MRSSELSFLFVTLSFAAAWAESHPVSQTEVVNLDELAQRTARSSESNPQDADAMKQVGQAWLESYLTGRRYFVLDVLPERTPPWSLRDTTLIPLHDDHDSGRRSGDGTVELENALQSLNEALRRASENQDIQVLLAYACLIARRHETITGVSLQGRPETAEFDDASPNVDLWEQRALTLCRAVVDGEFVAHSNRQDDPRGYACSIMHYLFEESVIKPRSDEERFLAAGGKEHYDFMKDKFELPVEATFKPTPTDLVALNGLYPEISREQNGALVYLNAMDALVQDHALSGEMDRTNFLATLDSDAMPENLEARLEALVNANTTCLDLMHQASAHSAFRYPVDFEGDWNFVSPSSFAGRQLAELLEMQALHGVLAGQVTPVLDSIRQLARLAYSMRNEPIDISQLAHGGLAARSVRLAELLVGRLALDRAQREAVQSILIPLDNFPGVRASWQVERLSIDRPVVDEDINDSSIGLEYSDLTPDQKEKSLSRIRSERAARIELLDALLSRASWEAVYAEVLAPSKLNENEKRVFVAILSRSAYVRAAITALALERYHAHHGDYPGDLSALVPDFMDAEFLVDPFSGKPLLWRTTANGFVVHSVGDPEDVARRVERAALLEDGQDPMRALSFKVERSAE